MVEGQEFRTWHGFMFFFFFFFTFCKSELVGRFMNSSSVSIFCVLKIRGRFKDAVELTRKFIIS